MSRAIDIRCAKALGWYVVHDDERGCYSLYSAVGAAVISRFSFGDETVEQIEADRWEVGTPYYSRSLELCVGLEQDIARRGLQEKYIEQLCLAIDGDTSSTGLMQRYWRDKLHPEHFWLLVTATAEQRARAFLAAVE